jgi:hypothetical protein
MLAFLDANWHDDTINKIFLLIIEYLNYLKIYELGFRRLIKIAKKSNLLIIEQY